MPQPDNLVVGAASGAGRDQLHLIDFGTAEPLRDRHGRPRADAQAAEGTVAFMAVSAHAKRPVSPRDDLEAFGCAERVCACVCVCARARVCVRACVQSPSVV